MSEVIATATAIPYLSLTGQPDPNRVVPFVVQLTPWIAMFGSLDHPLFETHFEQSLLTNMLGWGMRLDKQIYYTEHNGNISTRMLTHNPHLPFHAREKIEQMLLERAQCNHTPMIYYGTDEFLHIIED